MKICYVNNDVTFGIKSGHKTSNKIKRQKMEAQKIIVGEFENELYAEIAKRDLEAAGINASIIKNDTDVFIFFSDESDAVQLVIPGPQIEKAKQILKKRFI